tara:strand:- start:1747 stop:2628 length:882 start_codon:yes stop_codon:yes gene_type:complete
VIFEEVKPFINSRLSQVIDQPGVYLLGHPFDGTTSFRPGARFGPDAIRQASWGLETYSPYLRKDLTDYPVFDLGNLELLPSRCDLMNKELTSFLIEQEQFSKKAKLLTLGGEHSISYTPIKHYLDHYEDLVILHLDAHADFRDGYLEDNYSHASIMKRVYDHFSSKNRLLQYGIRSGTKEEFNIMEKEKTLFTSLETLLENLKNIDNQRPIYLTLDLDFFDPAYLPGTGTPEAGGESFHSFVKIMKVLNQKNLVGADVVELAPMLDSSQISSCMASKVVREVILSMMPITSGM